MRKVYPETAQNALKNGIREKIKIEITATIDNIIPTILNFLVYMYI